MGNGASRIFNIMKKSNETSSASQLVTLKVKTVNPLTFELDDRVILTADFYIISDKIDKSKLRVGDAVLATTFNNGQVYFIQQAANTNTSITSDPNYSLIYPVGSVYITVSSTSPTVLFGNKWKLLGTEVLFEKTFYYWQRTG